MERSSLLDLFDSEDQKVLTESQPKNKVVIFDTTNAIYRSVFSAIYMNKEDNEKFYFFRHLFINSIFQTILMFKPVKVIMALDERPSWRYEVYKDYKCNRKAGRDAAIVDFEKFFPILNTFMDQFKETFTKICVLSVPRSEADDLIAILCKDILTDDTTEKIIISNDSDLHQLINKNTKQYNPLTKKMVECLNPKKELDIKILTGDKTDSIPPVRRKVGEVTAGKILDNGLDLFLNESEENKQNYIRNKKLIDLNFIPENIKQNIINSYNNYKLTNMSGQKIMDFFIMNKLNKLMDNWTSMSESIKSLN